MKRPYYIPPDAMLRTLQRKREEFRNPWPMRCVWLFAALFWCWVLGMVVMLRP